MSVNLSTPECPPKVIINATRTFQRCDTKKPMKKNNLTQSYPVTTGCPNTLYKFSLYGHQPKAKS